MTDEISGLFYATVTYTTHCHPWMYNETNDNYNLLSHSYISREKRTLNIDILIANLIKVKKREKQLSIGAISKRETSKKCGGLQITFYQ